MTTHLIVPDPHSHHEFSNERFSWLGAFMKDLKPDVVVNMGDHADMPSLSSYDKGKASFNGRNYELDINAALDAHERMWGPLLAGKKKLPRRVILEGNHEHRIKKALEVSPELKGTKFGVSFNHLEYDRYYQEVIEYEGNTPGTVTIDGVTYGHYLVSGLLGKPVGGEHHALSLVNKYHSSCTVAHSHCFDYAVRSTVHGKKLMGCVSGVFQDYRSGWAGTVNNLWSSGLVVKRNVEDGAYDLQWISLETLRKEYSK